MSNNASLSAQNVDKVKEIHDHENLEHFPKHSHTCMNFLNRKMLHECYKKINTDFRQRQINFH
jgi:hypothetical protein